MTPKQIKVGLREQLKKLEKNRDSLRDLYDKTECALEHAENACLDLGRIIDDLSEII
jgi:hypothetical protein